MLKADLNDDETGCRKEGKCRTDDDEMNKILGKMLLKEREREIKGWMLLPSQKRGGGAERIHGKSCDLARKMD